MGIYDRAYYRDDPPSSGWSSLSVVAKLILINVGIFVLDAFFVDHAQIGQWMSLKGDWFTHPWRVWEPLTYGFAHDPKNLYHLAFNMLGLWFFGRELEGIYGRRSFLMAYLTMIIGGGLAWLAMTVAAGSPGEQMVIGASGGVMGLVTLYACHFPTKQVLLMGVFPIPIWALAITYFASDITGLVGRQSSSNVAYAAHIGGALTGFLFYRTRLSLDQLVPSANWWKRLVGPKLKVHSPHEPDDDPSTLTARVDQILEKISREGEASLTSRERKVLEDASRRYQRRRQ